jgi:hypothetical protein
MYLGLWLEKTYYLYLFFFFQVLAWLNWFGLVRFNRFQTLETEPELFCYFLIG